MKQYLVRDKSFLQELYSSQNSLNTKRLLSFASDTKIATVIKFLHFLANGEIPMKKVNFDALVAHKRLVYIKKALIIFLLIIKVNRKHVAKIIRLTLLRNS